MRRALMFVALSIVTVAVGLIVISYVPGASNLIASLSKKAA